MDKLKAFIQKIRSGYRRESPNIEPEFEIRDLATCMGEIDWTTLDVIHWSPAWMTPAERLLLYTLVFSLRPKRYLEIGTLNGGSALIVSAAIDAVHADGRLVCVDPKPQIDPDHWKLLEHRSTLLKGFSPDILPHAYEAAGGSVRLCVY
jgi:cephalosporin hydroxylase